MITPPLGRILIVDDEIELLAALCEMLTDQGYETVGRGSAYEALTLVQEQDIDLLLSDLMMPEMDGIALLRAALDIDPHLLGIIMTGQGTIQTAIDAMKVGAFDYILKPFKLQALLPILGRALQVRQLRMDNVQLRETVAIYELGQTIAYTFDVDTIVHNVVDGAMQQVNGTEACLMLPTPDGKELFVAAIRGKDHAALYGTRASRAHSVVEWVARHREPLTCHGTINDVWVTSRPGSAVSTTIVLPMMAGGTLVGVLSVATARRHRSFTPGQVKALSMLANLAATALANAAMYRQVRQSEERYRSVTEAAADAIISVDSHGTILSWNRGAQTIFGYTPEEIIGQPLVLLMPERYREACIRGLARLETTGERHLHGKAVELYGRKGDCSEFPIELSLSHWRTGEDLFFGAIIRDITQRQRLETQLRQAQKMQAIGTLAGGIAHDFNNILGIICGYTELALLGMQQDSNVWKDLRRVLSAGQRARDLVRQLLAFSRQTEIEHTPLQLHLLVKEGLTLLRAVLPSTVTIQQTIDDGTDAVLADPTQMHQVLLNLCMNAAHAMRDTGGVIEVCLDLVDFTADNPPPAPTLSPGPYVRLSVRDTGYGMTPEIMERIFEPFFTTKSKEEGTGMGLAVVHGIVTNHGGAIAVESAPEQGAMFTVYLPRLVSATPTAVSAEEAPPTGQERILFVDDDEALAYLGQAMLQHLGYTVVACTESRVALDTFRATPQAFDLVITDYTMPGITGEALAREVRRIRADIPIILCTGFSETITAESARGLGIDAFLLKPVTLRALSLVIRQVLVPPERRALLETGAILLGPSS